MRVFWRSLLDDNASTMPEQTVDLDFLRTWGNEHAA
jgi:hypothetical protein